MLQWLHVKYLLNIFTADNEVEETVDELHTLIVVIYITSTEKEICRLKWNWFFLILTSTLKVVNFTSPLPSLHQFVTNPTAHQLNGTGREVKSYIPSPLPENNTCALSSWI